jgi:hypothetical protein
MDGEDSPGIAYVASNVIGVLVREHVAVTVSPVAGTCSLFVGDAT